MRSQMKSSQPRLLFVNLLLLLSACCLLPGPCAANGVDPFALEASCLGGPNEESGSVFSITSIITCIISVAAPCDREYGLRVSIFGSSNTVIQSHEELVRCDQVQYAASFVVANRYILANRPFRSETYIHQNGQPVQKPVASPVHLVAPPPDFLMEETLAAAASSHPHVVSRLASDVFACSFPRSASRVYAVRGVSIAREKIQMPLPQELLQRVQHASGSWTHGEGEASEARIPAFQFDAQPAQGQPHANRATVVIAVGIVRGHVGHFSHFLVDYVVPVLRALHVYRKSAPAGMNAFDCEIGEVATCDLGNETTEVWLDHMDELATIPHRAFHSAFQEGDRGGMLGMKPWTTIHEGISRGSPHTFNLLFVFGGMQMTTVHESTAERVPRRYPAPFILKLCSSSVKCSSYPAMELGGGDG